MEYTAKGADISACGRYRYILWREWASISKRRMLFIMLNPSTADGTEDDPTIRSCVRLANENCCGKLFVVNLFAWRATNPEDLPTPPSMARGPDNVRTITSALTNSDLVVCAWGASRYAETSVGGVLDLAELNDRGTWCFGKTKSGAPKHPLYIKSGTPLEWFRKPIKAFA